MGAKDEFIELMVENTKTNGFDELTSKLIGILYVEPKRVCLDELSKRTGYSLSAVSTSLKFLENAQFVSRSKKPKSRKVFFTMEKNMITKFIQIQKRKQQGVILPTKQKLPKIIEELKKENNKDELKIAESYLQQVILLEEIMNNMTKMLEEAQKKLK